MVAASCFGARNSQPFDAEIDPALMTFVEFLILSSLAVCRCEEDFILFKGDTILVEESPALSLEDLLDFEIIVSSETDLFLRWWPYGSLFERCLLGSVVLL